MAKHSEPLMIPAAFLLLIFLVSGPVLILYVVIHLTGSMALTLAFGILLTVTAMKVFR